MINTFKSLNLKFALLLFSLNNLVNIHAQSASMGTSFCTTTTTACNTVSGCVNHTINVSGVGVLSLANVLNSIKVNMGSPACQGNLSTYDFTLISPTGVVLNFIVDLTTGTTNGWVNTTFIDNPNIENISFDFSATDQNLFNPWSIGYYAPEVDGSFSSTFNGINADGAWTFRVCEGATGNMISFNSACITFGAPIPTENAIGVNHDDCSTALCLDNTTLVNADNDGASVDPLYPGDMIGGCTWNNGNHESAWFKFQPTGTTATITLSGLDGPSGLGYQAIVLENSLGNGCPPSVANFTVPIGGCPDDESINNTDYLNANGGGTSIAGNVYQNDINFNMEFNLSGLTPNKVYYLYVDGNTTTVDETFIVELSTTGAGEGPNGTISCNNTTLPVEFLDFITTFENDKVLIYWSTASERNNNKFIVEKSIDHIKWISIDEINGAGNSVQKQEYYAYDNEPNNGVNYYRIKQIDHDGKFDYSFVRTMKIENQLMISPNPNKGNFMLYGLNYKRENNIEVFNVYGQKIKELNTINAEIEINLSECDNGIYYLLINQSKILKFIKN